MRRLIHLAAACTLGLTVLFTPVLGPATAFADEADDSDQRINNADDHNVEGDFATAQGFIYGIRDQAGAKVVTILNIDTEKELDVWFRDPAIVSQINNRTICVGKFATVSGVREDFSVMTGQGIVLDPSTRCGSPPQ